MSDSDLLMKSCERLDNEVLTDVEIDKIVKYAETIGKLFKKDEDMQSIVEHISEKAHDIRHNFDASAIEKVADTAGLNRAVNIYEERTQKTGMQYAPTELKMAEKLCDLSEQTGGREIFNLTGKLAEIGISSPSVGEDKEDFAGYIVSAYANISQKTELTPVQCKTMLAIVSDLAEHTEHPADAFSSLKLKPDDKSVAQLFLKEVEKVLDLTENEDKDVANGGTLIKQFAQVVKLHPEMAKECNRLVKKTANLQHADSLADCYGEAAQYFGELQDLGGVSFGDKSMAGREKIVFSKKAVQAKEREATLQQSETREKYTDFSHEMGR